LTQAPSQANEPKALGRTTAAIGRRELRTERARVIARPNPPTVAPQTSLREALATMRARRGEALLVLDGGRLAGIFTERDVLRRVLGRDVDVERPVSEFMTAAPGTLDAEAPLIEALRKMEAGSYRNLPLVDGDGQVVGVLRQQDLLEYIAEAFPQEILNLPPRPHQQMEEQEGA
jgi:CBS domain-containing protein